MAGVGAQRGGATSTVQQRWDGPGRPGLTPVCTRPVLCSLSLALSLCLSPSLSLSHAAHIPLLSCSQTMWDPARAVYSRWDDAGNVVDYPGEEHALTGTDLGTMTPHHRAGGGAPGGDGGAEPASCGFGQHVESEEEEYAAECKSTDDGSSDGAPADDGDLDARFIEYYKRNQRADTEGAGEDAEGTHDSSGAIVSGDWVWDGEFWNNADGVSYHPGLDQYFSHGQRIFPSEEDKPKLCDEKLLEDFLQKKYQARSRSLPACLPACRPLPAFLLSSSPGR